MNPAPAQHPAILIVAVMILAALPFLLIVALVVLGAIPWLRAYMNGAPLSLIQILGMRLRGLPPGMIVDALVTLVHRGHPHDAKTCYLAQSTYLARRGLIHHPCEAVRAC